MACRLIGATPLSKPTLDHWLLDPWEQISVKYEWKFQYFHSRNVFEYIVWKVVAILCLGLNVLIHGSPFVAFCFVLLEVIFTSIPRMLSMWHGISHYNVVIMGAMASQITSVSIVYSTVCLGPDQRKHQGSASLAFVRGIQRWPVNSPHKGPVTQKMFPFDDVIMSYDSLSGHFLLHPCQPTTPKNIGK